MDLPPVYVVGVGMTPFGYDVATTVKGLTARAVASACTDAGIATSAIQAAFFANSGQGVMEGQHAVRGEIALRAMGLEDMPMTNIENACAGGSTALNAAVAAVASGMADIALAVGTEKMSHPDREKSFAVFDGGWDVSTAETTMKRLQGLGAGVEVPEEYRGTSSRSVFMDVYAALIKDHMERFGSTPEDFAAVAAKNHAHAVDNPLARYRKAMTVQEILSAETVAWPLTVPMCAPLADGAAAALVCNSDGLRGLSKDRAVRIRATQLGTGIERDISDCGNHVVARTARRAYETAGVGPEDVDVAEVHDATAFAEIWQAENLGLCAFGEGARLARSGASALGGRIPINTSGGLESKGHPIGATGLGQVYEIVTQLRGEAGIRQVEGARIGLVENGGGFLEIEEAVAAITVLERT